MKECSDLSFHLCKSLKHKPVKEGVKQSLLKIMFDQPHCLIQDKEEWLSAFFQKNESSSSKSGLADLRSSF